MPKSYARRLEQNLLGLGLAAVILPLGAWGASATVLDAGASSSDGLVAEYRFDTGAGNTAYDTSGDNDGTLENSADWAQGIDGKSASFDGQDDYVDIPESTLQGKSSFTITSWAYSDLEGPNFDTWRWIVGSDGNFLFGGKSNSDDVRIHWNGNSDDLSTDIPHQEWVFWTLVVKESSIELYINGEFQDSVSKTGQLDLSGSELAIGSRVDLSEAWRGRIDTTKFYSAALNKTQVKSVYKSGSWRIGTTTKKDDPSKLLDISFQHQNSTHVYDTSGYENHGTRENGVGQASSVDCKIGRCYSFDGNDDYLEVSGLPDFSDTNEVTVSAWAKSDDEDWADTGWITSRRNQFIIHPDSGSKQVDFYVHTVNSGWSRVAYSPDDITKWHHYSLSYDGSVLSAYVDGEQADSTTINEQLTSDTGVMTVGRDDGRNRYGDGKVDEVRIYNRSLSQSEIIGKTQGLDSRGAVLDLQFNRDGGDLAEDSSGKNNHGRLEPNEETGPSRRSGFQGGYLDFDNNDDYVEIQDSSSLDIDNSFTWSVWIKPDSIGSDSTVFGKSNAYELTLRDNDIKIVSWGDDWSPSHQLSENEWHHITVTGKADGSSRTLYVDGQKVAEGGPSYTMDQSNNPLQIGRWPDQDGSGIDGKISRLKILDYRIDQKGVEEMYQAGSPSVQSSTKALPSPVLSQSFNRIETCGQSDTVTCPSGASGEIAVDESGEANHGELVSSPEVVGPEECIVGTCVRSTESSRIQDEDPSNLPESDSARTLSGWFKMTDTDKAGVFGYGNPNTNEGFQFYTPNGLGDELQFDFWGTNEGGVDDVIPSIKEKWYHVAATYDGNTITVYRNGQKIDSASYTGLNTNSERFVAGAELDRNDEFEGLYDQIKVFDRSLSEKQIWRLYAQGRDRSTSSKGPVLHYPMQTRSSPVADVSGEGNDGDINLLGEIGTFNTSDGEWRTVRFQRKYEDPVVVGTSNTLNGESALSFGAKNVDPGSAQVRLCESEGENTEGCDTHGTERASYMVVSASATEDIPGIEAGTLKLDSEIDSRRDTVSYSESFGSAPNVMANVNTDNGRNPVEARVTSFSASSFNIGMCYQDSTNGCDPSHVTEEVGYVALEPGNLPFEQTAETGRTGNSAGGSNFVEQTFSNTYQDPAVVVSTVSEDGGQETQIDEAANLGPGSVDVRYCEIENGDVCNGHTSENVAWFVAEEGLLTYTNGNFPRYVDTEKGKALEFDGSDDYVSVPDSSELDIGSSDATITFWLKTEESPDNYDNLVMKSSSSTTGNPGYLVNLHPSGSIVANIDDGSNKVEETGDITVNDGSWNFITVKYDRDEDMELFVNEQKDGEWSISGIGNADTSEPLRIGDNPNWGSGRALDGEIHDVRIYPYTLNEEQIGQVRNSGSISVG